MLMPRVELDQTTQTGREALFLMLLICWPELKWHVLVSLVVSIED